MSETETETETGPAAQITDFQDLYPRQVGYWDYVVLHLDGDDSRAYTVDIEQVDCTCPDFNYNRDSGKVCKHLAAALFAAPQRMDAESYMARDLGRYLDRLEEAAELAEDAAGQFEGALVSQRDAEAEQAAEGVSEPTASGPVDQFKQFARDRGWDMDGLDVFIHDQYGSLNIKTNGLPDDQFDDFRSWAQSTDAVKWDQNDRQNFIPKDRVEEALSR